MLELYQLEQLVTIANEGTISKAAEKLMISQPGLTRSIQRLEEDLELKLFDRQKNKITLNDNGKMAVQYARDILERTDRMVKELRKFDRLNQTIHIGSQAPAPAWGISYLLKEKYPEMDIDYTVDSDETKLLDGLVNHDFTYIVLTHPLKLKDMACTSLFKENLYLSVPPAHPLAPFKEIAFADLNGQSVLLLSHIGFWNAICQKMIPQSHLLFQDDTSIFNELTRMSALPNFRSNVTLVREGEQNRVAVPITDPEAHVQYYGICSRENQKRFAFLKQALDELDWTKTREYHELV